MSHPEVNPGQDPAGTRAYVESLVERAQDVFPEVYQSEDGGIRCSRVDKTALLTLHDLACVLTPDEIKKADPILDACLRKADGELSHLRTDDPNVAACKNALFRRVLAVRAVALLLGLERSMDVSSIFQPIGISKKIIARFNTHTYEADVENPENNWLLPAFRGFEELAQRLRAEGKTADVFATIGTGPGLDAIGACHILRPKTVVLTDMHKAVLPLAYDNCMSNVTPGTAVMALHGSLCAPLREHGILAHVLYGNLPLIPDEEEEHIDEGMRTATFTRRSVLDGVPEKYTRYLLGMKYAFLNDAFFSLRNGGSVVINLGGRVPVSLVQEMFEECGYLYEELYTTLKVQSQPEEVLPGFCKVERAQGTSFDFYLLDEARKILQGARISSAGELKSALAPSRVNAAEAMEKYGKGRAIGHVVQVIRGQKRRRGQS